MNDTLHIIHHPLIQHKLTIMRKSSTSSKDFRQLLDEISMLYRDGKLALVTGDGEGTYTLVSVYDRTGMLYGAVLNAGLSTQAVGGPWWFFDPMYRTELLWD